MLVQVTPTDTKNHFYFTCTTTDSTRAVTERALRLHNTLAFLCALQSPLRDLAEHGPLRRPEHKGLSEQQEGEEPLGPAVDQYRMRTGYPPEDRGVALILEAVQAIERLKGLHSQRQPLSEEMLEEAVDTVKGTLMIVYPQGLPEYEPARELLDELDACVEGTAVDSSKSYYPVEQGSVFFASRNLVSRGETMACLRCSETSTIRLVPSRSGSYVPRNSEDESRAQAMQYLFQREKSLKEAELNATDDTAREEWADPKALKRQLQGGRDITFK